MKHSHTVHDALARAASLVFALVAIAVLSPVLAAAALAVRITLGSPVLFRQVRPGYREKLFTLYKFRTMRDGAPGLSDIEASATDGQRLTKLGAFLRATSIDELPQLFNIVRGEMNLIGPRPLLVEYLGHYEGERARRHDVMPGMTGWSQVNGRNARSWDDRLDMDVYYVDHRSILLDLRIFWLSFATVFSRKGVSADGVVGARPLTESVKPPATGGDAEEQAGSGIL